jgi:ribose 5-phosphate isomerase B
MRIALGADHAGVVLKEHLKRRLGERAITFTDFGTNGAESVDYPDFATTVARHVASGAFERGVLVCGTGIGMAIAANKVAGIRGVTIVDERSAVVSREHNDANILALGARVTEADLAVRLLDLFLDTAFAGGRHQRRVDKLSALDQVPR